MFENIESYPYIRLRRERKPESKPQKGAGRKKVRLPRTKAIDILSLESLAACLVSFFMARAVLLGELVPFAASFAVAAGYSWKKNHMLIVLGALGGLATLGGGAKLAASSLAVICSCLLLLAVPPGLGRPHLVLPAIVLAATVAVKTPFVAFSAPSSYNYLAVFFEAAFACAAVPVISLGLEAFKKKAGKSPMTAEEVFGMLFLLGGLIAGTGDLKVGAASVKGVLSRLFILLAALGGGSGIGAAAGAVAGVIPGLFTSGVSALVGSYSFSGLLAGAFRSAGKLGTVTGFVLGNVILALYAADYSSIAGMLVETGAAVLLFLAVPSRLVEDLKAPLGIGVSVQNGQSKECFEAIKELLAERVKSWSRVVGELSLAFEKAAATSTWEKEEFWLQKLLGRVGDKVCGDCSFYTVCWERESYKMYQVLIDLLSMVEIYGRITKDDVPPEIKRRCSRVKELAVAVNCLYESYTLRRRYSQRIAESSGVAAEQLKGISRLISGLAGELDLEQVSSQSSLHLRKKLKETGARLEGLAVYGRDDGKLEIFLVHRPCGGRMECKNLILPLISTILGQNVYLPAYACTAGNNEQFCRLRFYPDLNYRLVLGKAFWGKGGQSVCGDSHEFFCLPGGRLGIVISDGMGSGPGAAAESRSVISLLRRLLECGFGQDAAVKTVNSLLASRCAEESFATVDLALVDLRTGEANLIKIGAAASFLLRGATVQRLEAASLPAGILEDIETASFQTRLEPGDTLVMVTDGVLDYWAGDGAGKYWLEDVLLDLEGMAPGEAAELILKIAQAKAAAAAKQDDMTVLVAKLERQKSAAPPNHGRAF